MDKLRCLLLHHDYVYVGIMRVNGERFRCYKCKRCGKRKAV